MAQSGLSTVELAFMLILVAIVPIINIVIYMTRYKKVASDKAMVIYGRRMPSGDRGYMVLIGGRKFIVPIVEEYQVLDLSPRTVKLELRSVKVRLGEGRAGRASGTVAYTYSISSDAMAVQTAAEHLLGLDMAEVSRMVEGYVEAAFKSHMACHPFPASREELDTFLKKSGQMIQMDLRNIGIELGNMKMDGFRLVEGG